MHNYAYYLCYLTVVIMNSVINVKARHVYAYTVIIIMSKMISIHKNPVNGKIAAKYLYKLHIKPASMYNV